MDNRKSSELVITKKKNQHIRIKDADALSNARLKPREKKN